MKSLKTMDKEVFWDLSHLKEEEKPTLSWLCLLSGLTVVRVSSTLLSIFWEDLFKVLYLYPLDWVIMVCFYLILSSFSLISLNFFFIVLIMFIYFFFAKIFLEPEESMCGGVGEGCWLS